MHIYNFKSKRTIINLSSSSALWKEFPVDSKFRIISKVSMAKQKRILINPAGGCCNVHEALDVTRPMQGLEVRLSDRH